MIQSQPVWSGTHAEAKARVDELGREYEKICGQLGAWKPTTYVPQSEFDEYRAWKRRALGAKEGIARELAALKQWLKLNAPILSQPRKELSASIAARLDALGLDYTADLVEAMRRRISAEMVIGDRSLLVLELVEMFKDHDPCGAGCDACALIERAQREVA